MRRSAGLENRDQSGTNQTDEAELPFYLFAADQQREVVKQAVDGVSRLVDGQDDGAAVIRHPETNRRNTVNTHIQHHEEEQA